MFKNAAKRLAALVTKSKKLPNNCIVWQGVLRNGYGRATHNGRRTRVHRLSLALHLNWPELLEQPDVIVRHTCGNRACINPEHLIPGTYKQNNQDNTDARFAGLTCPCCNHKF